MRGLIRGLHADLMDASERVPWEVAVNMICADYEDAGIFAPTMEERSYVPVDVPSEGNSPNGYEMGLDEIAVALAAEYGDRRPLSRERIRRIQNNAIHKLRTRASALRDFA